MSMLCWDSVEIDLPFCGNISILVNVNATLVLWGNKSILDVYATLGLYVCTTTKVYLFQHIYLKVLFIYK